MYKKADHYTKKAKAEGYEARSIYKLEEIQKKLKLIKPGQKILDLGCAPGSWSQYASKLVGPAGHIVGIDYKQITATLPNATFVYGNFLRDHNKEKIAELGPYDGIISDMAPDTSGDRLTDCYKSADLVREALDFAFTDLKKGGFFIAKIFQGGDEKKVMELMEKAFLKTRWLKPAASRDNSIEIFMIGIDFQSKPELEEKPFEEYFNDTPEGEMPW